MKLSAAWLIERAGFARGPSATGRSASPRATRSPSSATTAPAPPTWSAFARRVRDAVEERFGVRLVPEPVFWGGLTLD